MSNFLLNVASARKQLAPLFGVINNSTVLPILEDVAITKGKNITFTTTDLENVLVIEMEPLHQEGDFSFCLNGRSLKHFLTNSLSETISINVNTIKRIVKVKNGDFSLTSEIQRIDDYPKEPVIDEYQSITLDIKEIYPKLANALKFASNDDLRPAMTGVCLTDWKGHLYIVATDAHRLYFEELIKTPKEFKGLTAIIPKKGIRTFLQCFLKGPVTIKVNKNYIEFSKDGARLISRLIDARYPDWQKVLPENELEFSMQRKNLISFLKMASLFVTKATNELRLVVNVNGITISGGDKDFGDQFDYKMPIYNCNQQFAPFRFAVNLSFLLGIALLSKDEYCKFSHSGLPTKAMIIDDRILLMPLMLNDID